MSTWGSIAQWVVGLGTLVLAAVAVFQETIRGWFYKPKFKVSTKTEPPDCCKVPWTRHDGTFLADSFYLRIWVENIGNATAKNVEVYAKKLRRQRADKTWEDVSAFPPMNLKWANLGNVYSPFFAPSTAQIYFPAIAPDMGKHCDIGHITDPQHRHEIFEDASTLNLSVQQTSLAFDLMAAPNHKGHIVGPGNYQLDILVAAENARPKKRTITINIEGTWYSDETQMLRDGVGMSVIPV